MKRILDLLTGRFEQPLGPLFFLFGAVLILLGLTAGLELPAVGTVAAFYRWPAVILGVGLVLLAILIERGLLVSKPYIEEIPRQQIQSAGRSHGKICDGEMHWFNVPLGRCIPPHFDDFVKPAITNENVLFHDLKSVKPVPRNMAFRMINVNSLNGRKPEAHVFFYDESWMTKNPVVGREELIPKRMMKVNPGCELFAELQLICESYCFRADDETED